MKPSISLYRSTLGPFGWSASSNHRAQADCRLLLPEKFGWQVWATGACEPDCGTLNSDTHACPLAQYLEAWLGGLGCVPLYNLMEDAATAEICRTQVRAQLCTSQYSAPSLPGAVMPMSQCGLWWVYAPGGSANCGVCRSAPSSAVLLTGVCRRLPSCIKSRSVRHTALRPAAWRSVPSAWCCVAHVIVCLCEGVRAGRLSQLWKMRLGGVLSRAVDGHGYGSLLVFICSVRQQCWPR